MAGFDQPFPRETLDAFFAAVLVNDVVDAKLVPPATLPLRHSPARLHDYHRLCRQLWADGLDRAPLIGMAAAGMAGRAPDPETLVRFKQVRAKFKQLRYAATLCDRRGHVPPWLDRTTVTMGQLQDACRYGQRGWARARGLQLRLLVTPPIIGRMKTEAAALQFLDMQAFAQRLNGDLDDLAAQAARGPVTGVAFHRLRKVVSRHNSFWTAMAVLHPCPLHHQLFRWMSALNGAMGACHDGLVARRAAVASSYEAPIRLPKEVAKLLDELVRLPRIG